MGTTHQTKLWQDNPRVHRCRLDSCPDGWSAEDLTGKVVAVSNTFKIRVSEATISDQ